MALGDWKSKVGQTKDKLTESAGAALEKAGDVGSQLTELGQEKMRAAVEASMEEIRNLVPLLQNSGFIVGDVTLAASIPPAMGIVVEQRQAGSAHIEEALNREDLSKTQSTVLKSLKRIYDMNDLVEKYGHSLGQIELEMSVPPKVTAHLNSKASRAFSTDG